MFLQFHKTKTTTNNQTEFSNFKTIKLFQPFQDIIVSKLEASLAKNKSIQANRNQIINLERMEV